MSAPLRILQPWSSWTKQTVDHSCYIKNVLPVALKYGDEVFDGRWIFQQGDANSYQVHLIQEWSRDNFLSLIDKDRRASTQSRLESSG